MSVEYENVLKLSRHRDILLRAHARKLPRETALSLIEVLRWRYNPGHVDVVFKAGSAGLCEPLGRKKFRMTLPRKPDVGIVLHEYAHVLDRCKHNHGDRQFVDILDALLMMTQSIWDK